MIKLNFNKKILQKIKNKFKDKKHNKVILLKK